MQHITLREAIDANRVALTKRTLGAFIRTDAYDINDEDKGSPEEGCLYDYASHGYPGYRCAIGQCLNAESLTRIDASPYLNETNLPNLVEKAIVTAAEDELPWLYAIQRVHDCWMQQTRAILLGPQRADIDGSPLVARVNEIFREVFSSRFRLDGVDVPDSPVVQGDFEAILNAAEAWLRGKDAKTTETPA
jgi:hypothetical protein